MKSFFFQRLGSLGPCLIILSVLTACGGVKLPKTSPLLEVEQRAAIAHLKMLAAEPQPQAVETGYELSWNILGRSGRVSAHLQMDEPDQLRFSAHDPLGRTLYLAVADGESFTLVDNRAAQVRRGRVDGASWRSIIPEPLTLKDMTPLLGGRLENTLPGQIKAAQNQEQTGYWFIWQDTRGLSHHVLLDRERNLVARHLLLGKKKELLLDLVYLNYDQDRETGYFWPKNTELSGSLIKGTIKLERSGSLSFDPLPLSVFRLDIPPHFKVEQLR